MLNELRDLSRSLKEAGVSQQDWHPFFKSCPKNSKKMSSGNNGKAKKSKTDSGYITYKIFLGMDGRITDLVGIPPDEDITLIRKWETNNGFSFPAFNISPMLKPNNGENLKVILNYKKSKGNENIDWGAEIEKIINGSSPFWEVTEYDRVNDCLTKISDDILNQLGEVSGQYKSIVELCKRAKMLSAETLQENLKTIVIQNISKGEHDTGFINMLFATKDKDNKKIQLICDLNDWQKFAEYPPNHQAIQLLMNNRFISNSELKRQAKPVSQSIKDVFNEEPSGLNEKFPPVNLPVLGKVILRSMFKDIPCQQRYGMIESGSFPVGAKVKTELKRALEWLGTKERKDKTWCNITGKVDKASLLFAYPTKRPESAPELAGLMGGEEENIADPDGASFSAIAERVTKTLRGISNDSYPNEVRIFVLAKMDKARTKVLVSRRYTAEHTIESAEQWQAGCRNIPNIKIRQYEDKTSVWKECLVPFPAEVVWCLNTAWRRQGTYAEWVHGFSINDALSLLLDEGNEVRRLSQRAIDAIVRNCAPRILAIGQENTSGKVFKINKRYEKQALLLPSILGLLLYKNGIEKGGFMNSPAYLVGRFLSLADDLHLKYCQHVRKGSIPPQLVGNALMPTALETPEKALSMISNRILPYWAWAATFFGDGQDVGLVKYFISQIREISSQIKDTDIPKICTDTDKAQMLLGYLARSEKSE